MLTLTEQLQRAVRQTPNAVAVIDQHQTDTWAGFGNRVIGIARALISAGVSAGDRVTVVPGTAATTLPATSPFPGSEGSLSH